MTILEPRANKSAILDFIRAITENTTVQLYEIRCIRGGNSISSAFFSPQYNNEATDLIIRKNQRRYNIYMTINPIDPNSRITKAATDTDIKCAHFCFADADDEKGMEGLQVLSSKKPPDIVVTTGTIPYMRQHHYWRLNTPCTDMEKWRSYQKLIATSCGTDKHVINSSRLMRVAGTVSYPSKKKIAKGYVPELVSMHTRQNDGTK
tara:strand:- start:1364 stop:1981 length:618 start_codon:yes stop_codon:yes gene_type:complete